MKRSRLVPALALTAILALAGCSAVGSDTGVSVDGQSYSMDDLHQATTQLNEAFGPQAGGQQLGAQQVIASLALLPLLDQVFEGSPAVVSDTEVRSSLGENGVSDPGPATMDAERSRLYQTKLGDPATLQDPAMAEVLARAQSVTEEDLAAVDVEVNPRYGTWDVANGGLVPQVPAWIQSSDDS
ncbi:hypothetical protein [Ornithinimicrobium avium]|uniref:hypothetical protein n=1 Tax=Ornithinimicrobium avium TaxID=2283195 RepID=UPI001D1803DA|nr:hypothetical protein [Ornithinimicrobium avium]